VLPDNCVDILWQDGGQPGFAVGMMSRAIVVASARPVLTVAVRFKPGAARVFLAAPLHTLTDQRADIDLLWGRGDAERLADALWTDDLPERARLALIEHALLRRLGIASVVGSSGAGGSRQASGAAKAWHAAGAGSGVGAAVAPWPAESLLRNGAGSGVGAAAAPWPAEALLRTGAGSGVGAAAALSPGEALVRRALRALDACHGDLRIEELAARLGVSRQHIAAQFRDQVGLSPKLYARICRFRRATAALKTAPARAAGTPDWAQIALDCGYFDQSHLIHDFHEFADSAPERFHFSNRDAS
jgi:AraC-like DNA-binding protein